MAGRAWRLAPQPPLGWVETALKLVAIGVGLAALGAAGGEGGPSGPRLAQVVVLGLLALGLVAAIADRLAEREILAMGFVVLNSAGHWAMLAALVAGGAGGHLTGFAALMLAGDAVKVVSIARGEVRVRDVPRRTLAGLTAGYAVGYAVLLALQAAAG